MGELAVLVQKRLYSFLLRITMDHHLAEDALQETLLSVIQKRIKRVHVKDFKCSIGTVEGFVDLLEGDVDFQTVKEALTEIGYDGYVTAEMLPFRPGRPEKMHWL